MNITVITDPVNTAYGAIEPEHFHQLKQNNIDLVMTDLTALRASNPAWSGLWYMCCQGLGNSLNKGWLPNPVGSEKVTLRSYLYLLNFKANHRKTLIVDTLNGWKALISSANPHDGSSLNSNVAMVVHGKSATDVLESEQAAAKLSGGDLPIVIMPEQTDQANLPKVQILTEKAIYDEVLQQINSLQQGEKLDVLMFYFSERKIIQAIKAAKHRGVDVRIILDPNKDAFGRIKNGMPNRQVAKELHEAQIPIRWCDTHGEQCHSKMLILNKKNQQSQMILGSANLTARNLKNYNLETDVSVKLGTQHAEMKKAQAYFDQLWTNQLRDNQQNLAGQKVHFTTDYATYQDNSVLKYWTYRFKEWSGFATF